MKLRRWLFFVLFLVVLGVACLWIFKRQSIAEDVGQPVDSLNGVIVYYNGAVSNVKGRNLTSDNYNLGLKYQCVEFVKRYYYQYLAHKMPDSYGDAKDFFDPGVADGNKNKKRALIQYRNPSKSKPKVDDLVIFSETSFNKYGHVAIISNVTDNEIEIIQQNPGPLGKSRATFPIEKKDDKWQINNYHLVGWLRKE